MLSYFRLACLTIFMVVSPLNLENLLILPFKAFLYAASKVVKIAIGSGRAVYPFGISAGQVGFFWAFSVPIWECITSCVQFVHEYRKFFVDVQHTR